MDLEPLQVKQSMAADRILQFSFVSILQEVFLSVPSLRFLIGRPNGKQHSGTRI